MSPMVDDRKHRDLTDLALRVWAAIGILIICFVVLNVLGILAEVVEFLAVGSLIAFVEAPIVNWLEHHGCPRGAGALIGLVVVVAVIACVVVVISPIFFTQVMEILAKLPAQMRGLSEALADMLSRFKTFSKTPMGANIDQILSSTTKLATSYVSQLAGDLGKGMFPLISSLASQVFVIFLGLVLAYWLACDYPRMHREVCVMLGDKQETSYRFMMAILSRSVGGYMRGMVITSFANGVLAFLGFALVGHPYAGLMGVITGLMHLIPVVGPWVSAAIATVLGFVYDPMLGVWTLTVSVVVQNIVDNVLSPKVMQSAVQVHPAMSLTALIIGSTLMGPIGMVVAIPLSAALKGLFIFYFENETKRQLVSYEGAIFKGTPFVDADGNPVAAYDALGDTSFVDDSELITDDVVPEGAAVPRPQIDNPWAKIAGLQPGQTGPFKIPFVSDEASANDDSDEDDGR